MLNHPAHPPEPRFAYVIPTRDRPEILAHTLSQLAELPPHDASILLIDNASQIPASEVLASGIVPAARSSPNSFTLPNAITIRVTRSEENLAAAARNLAVLASDPLTDWIVMLDDDSFPIDLGFIHAARAAPPTVAAIAGEIFLPSNQREAGGLPEIVVGCGCLIRRQAFLNAAGYDPAFHYYAEEYDLCAKLIRAGFHIRTDRRARFLHRKVAQGRDFNLILARLVRNNAFVMQRYAPDHLLSRQLDAVLSRYHAIAVKENALQGYNQGLAELRPALHSQPRTPLSPRHWDRFTGKAAARRALLHAVADFHAAHHHNLDTLCLIDEGKNADIIREAIADLGLQLSASPDLADALIVGTLSPGPMWDSLDRARTLPRPVYAPFREFSHAQASDLAHAHAHAHA